MKFKPLIPIVIVLLICFIGGYFLYDDIRTLIIPKETSIPLAETPVEPLTQPDTPEAIDKDAEEEITTYTPTHKNEYATGLKSAPHLVRIFYSFTCPHCRKLHQEVLPIIEEAYVKTGKIKLSLYDVPVDQISLMISQLAHCELDFNYNNVAHLMFQTQDKWLYDPEPKAAVERILKLNGQLTPQALSCLQNEAYRKAIIHDTYALAQQYKVELIPMVFFNEQRIDAPLTIGNVKQVFDGFINKPSK